MQLKMSQDQENRLNNSKETSSNNKSNVNILNLNRKGLNNLSSTNTNGNKTLSSSSSSTSSTINDISDSSNGILNLKENKEGNLTKTESKKGSYIKIGDDFQADLSEYDPKRIKISRQNIDAKEIPIWKPAENLTDKQIDDYLNEAISNHSYNIEQALAFLYWNKHNISKSLNEMNKYVPKPDEWTQEEKILFEQAYSFNGKNFSKIKQILPDKSQGSLVTYYYNWKKSRLISQIESQQNSTKNSNGFDYDQNERNNDDNAENASDDNDSVDDNYNSNVNKICCNCDLITSELQSTTKGQLCMPCFTYYKQTGLMRPDHVINKSLANNSSHRPNFPQNGSLLRTNRYLTISNTFSNNCTEATSNASTLSRDARNFHKSLRKPPKGIYLNYDELMDLVQVGPDKVFEDLKRKNTIYRKKVQSNKQEIDLMIKQIAVESDILKSGINNLLFKSEDEDIISAFWSPKEISLVLQALNKFGDNFETISQVIQTKTPESIKSFYSYYKDSLNLDKLINSNSRELAKKSNEIFNNLKKLNRPEIPVKTNESTID